MTRPVSQFFAHRSLSRPGQGVWALVLFPCLRITRTCAIVAESCCLVASRMKSIVTTQVAVECVRSFFAHIPEPISWVPVVDVEIIIVDGR